MAELKYEIVQHLATIAEGSKGWSKELNLVSWNERDPKFDLREWSPDHTKMGKGITLTYEEMQAVCDAFADFAENEALPKAAANLTGKVLLYYNSIAVPFPYMVAGVGRAVQDVVGQEKSEKSPENRAKKLANGSDVWYTNPCVTALLICDDAGGGRRAAVTTAAQTGNFRGVCPI